jgi:hypothetical protein
MQATIDQVPIIYSRPPAAPDVPAGQRVVWLAVSLGCLAVLIIAASLKPDPRGVGTHHSSGLFRGECQFLDRTGLPCPTCGMTTSFSWFARGNFVASFYVQPMGFVLATLTALTFWFSGYIAITAKPAHRLLRLIRAEYYLFPLLALAILAWVWKSYIHMKGIDGWH